MKTPNPSVAILAILVVQASSSLAHAQTQGTPPLQRFELPYQGQDGGARRVIVQVKFNARVTAPMALDTGAPGMVLSLKLAEKLEVFSRDQGKLIVAAKGIGGNAPAIRTILESVTIGGAMQRFVPVTITAQLSDSEAFEGLVGMDFMSQYSMTIDSRRKVVVLQEQPSTEEAPGGHNEAWWRDNFAEFRTLRDAWRRYLETIEREISAGATRDALMERRKLATFQYREAEKLLSSLERYASTQSVPRHWR